MTSSVKIKKKITEDYWFSKVSNAIENNSVTIRPQKKKITTDSIFLDKSLCSSLDEITKGNSNAKYIIHLTCFSILLKKHFNSKFLTIETPKWLNSDGEESKNPVLFDITYNENASFKDLLNEVKQEVQNSLKHIDYDRDELQTVLKNNKIDLSKLRAYHFILEETILNKGLTNLDFYIKLKKSELMDLIILTPFFLISSFLFRLKSDLTLNFSAKITIKNSQI